jgi:hypothetical protein
LSCLLSRWTPRVLKCHFLETFLDICLVIISTCGKHLSVITTRGKYLSRAFPLKCSQLKWACDEGEKEKKRRKKEEEKKGKRGEKKRKEKIERKREEKERGGRRKKNMRTPR